jgi:hypothetical protein
VTLEARLLSIETSSVLRRVGIVLIIVGMLDIGWMIYVISSGQSYASSFNIFAVIAGVLLYRQSLRTARVVTSFSAFLFTGFVGLLLISPSIVPIALIRTFLRITPTVSLISWSVLSIGLLVMLWWVHKSLASPSVQEAIRSAGQTGTRFWSQPRAAFWFGAALPVGLAVIIMLTKHSDTALEAVKRANEEKGPSYHYFLSALSSSWTSVSGTHVRATVLAYTDSEIQTIRLEWRE